MFLNKSAKPTHFKISDNQHYKKKYVAFKKYMISMIYENAALCDQITYLQDKILCIKEENNYLSKKVKHIEFIRSVGGGDLNNFDNISKKVIVKRKLPVVHSTQDAVSLKPAIKIKKPTKHGKKKQTSQASEEGCRQLIFPIRLSDDFAIQCLGEIVTDRMTFHTEGVIYPVGYTVTRVYGSVHNPKTKCSYTCKIVDGGMYPRFEINSEDIIFLGTSPDDCHRKLLSMINENYSAKVVNDTIDCGADFFGLTNPTVHYLILSLPDVSKCNKYSFKKFNEKISLKDDLLIKDDIEACTKYSALMKVLPDSFNHDHYMTDAWLNT